LRQLRDAAFPAQSDQDFNERFRLWNGVPRNVVSHSDDDGWQSELMRLADAVDPNLIAHLTSVESLSQGQLSNRIFLMVLKSDENPKLTPDSLEFYALSYMRVCSDDIARRIFSRFADLTDMQARDLALTFDKQTALSVLGGKLIEKLAIVDFLRGGSFEVRRLGTQRTLTHKDKWPELTPAQLMGAASCTIPNEFKLVLQASTLKTFEKLTEVFHENDLMQVPESSNACAIDFLLPGNVPVNVTLNPAHKLVLSGSRRPGLLEVWERRHSHRGSGTQPDCDSRSSPKLTSLEQYRPSAARGYCDAPPRALVACCLN
jgi:hypothetical protein